MDKSKEEKKRELALTVAADVFARNCESGKVWPPGITRHHVANAALELGNIFAECANELGMLE